MHQFAVFANQMTIAKSRQPFGMGFKRLDPFADALRQVAIVTLQLGNVLPFRGRHQPVKRTA